MAQRRTRLSKQNFDQLVQQFQQACVGEKQERHLPRKEKNFKFTFYLL